MNINIKKSLKNKLILSTLSVIFVFGLIIVCGIFFYSKNILISNDKKSLEIAAVEQTHEISQIFYLTQKLIEKITEQDFIIDYLKDPNRKLQDDLIVDRIRSYNIGNTYSAIFVIDTEGFVLSSDEPTFVGENISFRKYFKEGINGNPYIAAGFCTLDGEFGYFFSHPVKGKEGKILGLLVLKMKPDFIENTISFYSGKEIGSGKIESISLFGDYGVIVYSDNPNNIFKNVVKLSPQQKKELETYKRFVGVEINPLKYTLDLSDVLNIVDFKIFEVSDDEKEEKILGIAKLPNLPFFVMIEQNKNIFTRGALNISFMLGLFIFFLTVIIITFLYFLVGKFLKPLSSLNMIAKKAITGDLSQRFIVETNDEIGDLGSNFNKMISKIQKNIEIVEKKVLDRTKELENVNKAMAGRETKMIELKKEIEKLKKTNV